MSTIQLCQLPTNCRSRWCCSVLLVDKADYSNYAEEAALVDCRLIHNEADGLFRWSNGYWKFISEQVNDAWSDEREDADPYFSLIFEIADIEIGLLGHLPALGVSCRIRSNIRKRFAYLEFCRKTIHALQSFQRWDLMTSFRDQQTGNFYQSNEETVTGLIPGSLDGVASPGISQRTYIKFSPKASLL